MSKIRLAAALALAPAAAGATLDHAAPAVALLETGLRAEIETPALVAAVAARNAERANASQAEIDALDAEWRAQVEAGGGPLVDAALSNPLSDALRALQQRHGGLVTEIIVTDRLGLNVAQSDPTSDFWQGDEAKFTESYAKGAEAVFVDAVEFDESTQTMQTQLSFTLVDPASGEPVGAVTVGLDVDRLLR